MSPIEMNSKLLKRIGFAACATALYLLAVFAGLRIYSARLGIKDPSFCYENQVSMWKEDAVLGFVNKPGFSGYCFGDIKVETNDLGFRGTRPVSKAKQQGVTRVIGMGDSVMWGTCVNEEDSLPGALSRELNSRAPFEVINASVVGYSTYQEFLYLRNVLLALNPDIVLVNFCMNDYLPTDDPFGNVRALYMSYFSGLAEPGAGALNPEEKAKLAEMAASFGQAEQAWDWLKSVKPERQTLIRKLLVDIPMERMAALCKESGARLIYLFIPLREQDAAFHGAMRHLRSVLESAGAEQIDLSSAMRTDRFEVADWARSSRPQAGSFRELPLVSTVFDIVYLKRIRSIQRANKYIDTWHPTIRGNRIIAREVSRYLQETPGK